MQLYILVILGFLVGSLVISIGGGGGAFYLGILTSIVGLSAVNAAATSLYVSLPSLIIGCLSYWHTGYVKIRYGNKMIFSALPTLVFGSLIAKYIPEIVYKWTILVIFVFLGLQILSKTFRKNKAQHHLPENAAYLFGALSGLMVGIAGMSGGAPMVAGLLLMGLNMPQAAATSSYILIMTSIVGLILHVAQGNIDWSAGSWIMIGALVGAAITPRIIAHFDPKKITALLRPVMAILMILMGINMVI
ncbi:sulfite exporter TauE/SafE family protein [Oenococcus sicerae]|uniref:Probable membrane transporter protein n=1 Tax=Oenococcus sicerae TaxID=2203724 RepID=A0AAJ1R8K1_9LACO|nr:sulfite exporter TauE/SafE family protein [Oenococcus sicerae]MDN6899515.1 sulfite exporter TauE/SafE family protein [Oenococcus sicerae]QAS70209.1 sulfite exporter TauE/SafE family protein [Oenococcus sicerae]VDK14008.1 hypothetical protein OAL24_00805 [Oenococcus sicerae]